MIFTRAIFRFKGGSHPYDYKSATAATPLKTLPLPPLLTISLAQHLGAPAKPLVAVGDKVVAGQQIAAANGFISAAVHSPASGTVKALQDAPTPTGRIAAAIVIETDATAETDDTATLTPLPEWESLDPKVLVERVAAAGIVGMGGAGFPTHVKLSPPSDKPIDTLILNGAECEPFLNSDNRLMIEQAAAVVSGCRIIRHILKAKRICYALEDNKAQAAAALAQALKGSGDEHEIHVLPTLYPQGSEKQQIFAVTGRTVPAGGLPMDVGCVVNNVSTAFAIYEAVVKGRPLTHRAVTLAGDAITTPSNWIAPIGTSFNELVAASGGYSKQLSKVVCGGPMMGFALPSLDVALNKTSSGLLLFGREQLFTYETHACINCTRCVAACPMRLMPTELSQAIEADDIDEAERLNVMDCFECGACAYECPARRPLVQHMRRAKAIITQRRRAAQTKP